ncbi:MAG: type II toxin-antitoxin system HicA family toxin [Patescibacteria group bacterium]
MTRGVFNWTYKDVVDVLKAHGFRLNDIDSSHHFYIRFEHGRFYQVTVPFHGSRVLKPRTLKSMILQSGLTKEEWGI